MKTRFNYLWILASMGLIGGLSGCANGQKWSEETKGTFNLVTQTGGPTLGYSPASGVKLLTVDGFAFKDLNRNDTLDAYEDWRLTPEERAKDLASKLSIDEIAGLMLYSAHQSINPNRGVRDLKTNLTEEQKRILSSANLQGTLMKMYMSGAAGKEISQEILVKNYQDYCKEKAVTPDYTPEQLRFITDERTKGEAMKYLYAVGSAGGGAHYNGKTFIESGAQSSDLTDEQKKFLKEDNLRAVLITSVESPKVAAEWNNNLQAFVEGLHHGVPANTSSDPRHQSDSNAEFNAGGGGDISLWPSSLGMAATFDVDLMRQFGDIASQEYRALGIATALSPQVDVATEPRWWRFSGTFGEDADLATDLARAYCDGFQTSPKELQIEDGWGYQSVNAMVKHWYGYGAQEAGRDSHFGHGKFAVFPGNNLELQKKPFTEGAFKLSGGTKMASAVMPIYSILWNQDPSGENVGGSYSKFVIQQELRDKAGFDGVACTDWGITHDCTTMATNSGKPWGVENLSIAERHYRILLAGVDQFGGNNDKGPVVEAYQLWAKDHGEKSARERFEKSAYRLLLNIFRVGLFENPYLDPEHSDELVGNPDFMKAGYDAQLKSIVMLKNHAKSLPITDKKKVYVPKRHFPAIPGVFGGVSEEKVDYPVNLDLVKKYYDVVETAADADFALCIIDGPNSGIGYSEADQKKGGTGYVPVSLQYLPYTAVDACATSIAGGDPLESFTNRTYKGKSIKTYNEDDLKMVQQARAAMGTKPVIVVINTDRPIVLSEVEPLADAILLSFGVQNQAILDVLNGKFEPSGLLPMQMPANMKTVEEQKEDMPRDMVCYRDADGNTYDFAFGLNWEGVINDARVQKYK